MQENTNSQIALQQQSSSQLQQSQMKKKTTTDLIQIANPSLAYLHQKQKLEKLDEANFQLIQQLNEFTGDYQELVKNQKFLEKQIQNELEKQINISRKPKDLPQLYEDNLQPMNMLRKKLWYRLYKYWHEPFIEKNYDGDKLLILKQQNEQKKRLKKRRQQEKQAPQLGTKQLAQLQLAKQMQKSDESNDSDSVNLELMVQEQKKQKNEQDQSGLTEEFMNGEDDPDNDEMAQIISKKVDPFNINHKKNQNLYRDTLLECIGLKPHKLVKNVSLPQFYVSQYKKQKQIRQKQSNWIENIQVCDPNKKKQQDTKNEVQSKIDDYLSNYDKWSTQKLTFAKTLETDKQEIKQKSKKLFDKNFNPLKSFKDQEQLANRETIKIEKVIRPDQQEVVFFNKRRMKSIETQQSHQYLQPGDFNFLKLRKMSGASRAGSRRGSGSSVASAQNTGKGVILNQKNISKLPNSVQQARNQNMKKQIENFLSPLRIPVSQTSHILEENLNELDFIEAPMPKYFKVGSQSAKYQLRKFYERIERSSRKTENNLAFQDSRANRVNYPCINTETLLEKAKEQLKSNVAQAKINEIHNANQQEWIDEDAKADKLQRIANGYIELTYDHDEEKKKYRDQLLENIDSFDQDALDAVKETVSDEDELSLKDFQAIAKEIQSMRLKQKESPKRSKQVSQLTTRRQSAEKTISITNLANLERRAFTPRLTISSAQSSRYGQNTNYGSFQSARFLKVSDSSNKQGSTAATANEDVQKANQLFTQCREVLVQGNQSLKQINGKEQKIQRDFDYIKDRATHNIQLGDDDIKLSVDDFHNKKHIFIYNKDLSKGYFLRIDPQKINEIASRLQTFKFREPRIVADDDKEAEIKEKARLEKYFHKRFKSEVDAKALRPKYTEKFLSKVQAATELCTMKLKEQIQGKNNVPKK